jgi:aryl-alcohol dehydrogenase-like predicted oxidoreductase
LRIGLGCMRLATAEPLDEERAIRTIAAAVDAGVTVFDTARAYGPGPDGLGVGERMLAEALRSCGAQRTARIVTKGGMAREGRRWIPDGRAKVIRGDCEASLVALDGLPIDLYLIHAPDPRAPWRTSMRAVARLVEERLVARVGVANVNLRQLEEALDAAPVACVQVALSVFDDRALRGGVLERCAEAGIAVIAHSPLGGPRRAARIVRHQVLAEVADEIGATPAEVALAWLLALAPGVVAIPGAGSPGTARSAARAGALVLGEQMLAVLGREFGAPRSAPSGRAAPCIDGDVLLVVGIPGAGKSRLALDYVARGYLRLNRDERGGSLSGLAAALDERLAAGVRRIVLESRRHGVPARCVWLDTPLPDAQVNLVGRLLERVGDLPSPDELRRLARREPGVLPPTSQMRALRELEAPSTDEGFASVERVPFTRSTPSRGLGAVFVAAAASRHAGWEDVIGAVSPTAPHLVFEWIAGGSRAQLAPLVARVSAIVAGPVEGALCPHAAGPPICWCRPPLPGMPLTFARNRGVDVTRSVLVGATSTHRTLAAALGARYVQV